MRQPEAPTGKRPETVRIWLLGGFRVSVGSRTIEDNQWRLRKAASLIKLLTLAPGHRLHREQAMDLLWPDLGKKAASNNLRQALHGARRTLTSDPSLGARYLVSEDESLVLCSGGNLWVDVEAFEEAAVTARRSRDPAAYRAALELYTGELLPEDRYEEWAEEHRQRLQESYLSLLLWLARIYEERAEYDPAAEALQTVVSEQSIREEAHAGLMRLYALMGSKAEALTQYGRLEEILLRELATEPAASSRALREEIASGRFPPKDARSLRFPLEKPPGVGKHNLPAPRTSFVGRESEMLEVKRLLAMSRLLTLTGAGGSGKTRLALEVARDLVGLYPDGVWLVELAPLTEPELVVQSVASTLEVREQPERPLLETLIDALGDKEMLLLVDNCEHLVNAAAHLADALLSACPMLRILTTAREPLGVGGEALWQIPPLSLPATTGGESNGGSTVESLMRYEAVRLFVDRARLRMPDFGLTQENASAVARVCRKLEGIPLAIELATARMGALAVEQVAQRLEVSLDVLKSSSRTTEPRQRTLRATLDWSHKLLSEAEQALFGRLSVFAGGWTLEAAEAVCSGGNIERDKVLDLISSLVDKSLIVAEASTTGGSVRYRMLEPIRQYAWEKLGESGEADEVQGRHAAFVLALAEEAEPELTGPNQREQLDRLEAEHDNLRAVLSRALERGEPELALRLGGALWRFWLRRGHLSEGRRWLEGGLARDGAVTPSVRARALDGLATLADGQGDFSHALDLYEETLALYRQLGDNEGVATSLCDLGWMALQRGDYDKAKEFLEESITRFRESGKESQDVHALAGLAEVACRRGEHEQALVLYEEVLLMHRRRGDEGGIAISLSNLGWVALVQGNFGRATELLEESYTRLREAGLKPDVDCRINLGLAVLGLSDHERAVELLQDGLLLSRELGDRLGIATTLEGMAMAASAMGRAAKAACLWGAAEKLREAMGAPVPPDERSFYEPYLDAACATLDAQAWQAAWEEGRKMTLEEAVEYALSEEKPAPSTPPVPEKPPSSEPLSKLTRREQEVALLLAQGLTNRQISSELMLSEHTVATHVRNVLKKLGLRSRTQIAGRFTEQHKPLL